MLSKGMVYTMVGMMSCVVLCMVDLVRRRDSFFFANTKKAMLCEV